MKAERKVSPEQIDRLYLFTREHFVEYYDLQTELVDHLANAIEQQWVENPALSFEQALKIEFSKFGVFGFMNVVEAREAAMRRKYDKIIFSIFKQFFQIPNIILTIAASVCMFFILKFVPYPEYSVAGFSIFFFITALWKATRSRLKLKNADSKKWLFHIIINSYGAGSVVFMFMFYTMFYLNRFLAELDYSNNFALAFVSILMVSFSLYAYIVMFYVPKKSEMYLRQVYPEYKFATDL